MNQVWLQLMALMLGSSILKSFIPEMLVWVLIDLAVFAACYWLLSRYPYVDLKRSMMFIAGITGLNILIDIGLISGMLGSLLMFAILIWLLFKNNNMGGGGGPRRNTYRYKWHK